MIFKGGFLAACGLLFFQLSTAKPMIVAHRGASFDAPENTLPAFELARKQKADAIEGDFLLTKDKQIVCIHDKTTKRFCQQDLIVAETILKDLKALDVGSWKSKKYAQTQIPTIGEVFATIPKGKKIFVEVKCGPEIIPPLISEIKKSDLEPDQIILICFKAEVIREFKQKMPEFKAFWLSSFEKENFWKPSLKTVFSTLKNCNADGLDSQHTIPAEFSNAVLEAGFEWHAWTVNDVGTAKRLAKRGIYSITTDRPKLIGPSLGK